MKKILLITLISLSITGVAQVDSNSVNSMIDLAISQQSKVADNQLKEIRNSFQKLQKSLNN